MWLDLQKPSTYAQIYILTTELIKFCTYSPPQILHFDQGKNFKNSIFTQTLHTFSVQNLYHLQGDNGMVEHFKVRYPWGLYLICKHNAQGCNPKVECLEIRYKLNGCVITVLLYSAWADQRHLNLCLVWRRSWLCIHCGWWTASCFKPLSCSGLPCLTHIKTLLSDSLSVLWYVLLDKFGYMAL